MVLFVGGLIEELSNGVYRRRGRRCSSIMVHQVVTSVANLDRGGRFNEVVGCGGSSIVKRNMFLS